MNAQRYRAEGSTYRTPATLRKALFALAVLWGTTRAHSSLLEQITRFPALVKECLLGPVKPHDHQEALVRYGLDPVLALARRFRAKVDIGGAVAVLHRLIHLIERRERLAVVQARGGQVVGCLLYTSPSPRD